MTAGQALSTIGMAGLLALHAGAARPLRVPRRRHGPALTNEPCGPCGTGTLGPDGTCAGALARPVEDLVGNAGTIEATTVFDGDFARFGPELARDGDRTTSWFSTGPDAGSTELSWTSTRDDCITAVRILNNGEHAEPAFQEGFGFGSARIRLFRTTAAIESFEVEVDLSEMPDPDVMIEVTGDDGTPGVLAGRLEIVFSGHEDPTCGGISEVGVSAYFE